MGSQISCSRCRSDIRAAFPTRLPVGVRYNEERACYEGLPDEWKHINQQFGVPLSQVPRSLVEGYDERIPSILLMMERFLKANNGRDQASSLLTGARRTGERSRSFCAFVRVIWTGVVRVHSRPLTFFLSFPARRLPLSPSLPTARTRSTYRNKLRAWYPRSASSAWLPTPRTAPLRRSSSTTASSRPPPTLTLSLTS